MGARSWVRQGGRCGRAAGLRLRHRLGYRLRLRPRLRVRLAGRRLGNRLTGRGLRLRLGLRLGLRIRDRSGLGLRLRRRLSRTWLLPGRFFSSIAGILFATFCRVWITLHYWWRPRCAREGPAWRLRDRRKRDQHCHSRTDRGGGQSAACDKSQSNNFISANHFARLPLHRTILIEEPTKRIAISSRDSIF